jgi:NH3-dependent NAD+ synthetase
MPVLSINKLIDERVESLRAYHKHASLSRAELDLSGGIDSAVMAGLLVEALGREAVTLVYSSINSGSATRDRAQDLADALGVALVVHDLTTTYEEMVLAMLDNLVTAGWDREALEARIASDNTILGSIRSCLRAPLGRGYLRLTGNGLRHGTGNECEDRWLRFYQKGGDGEVDSNPISMLSKGEVYQLAFGLGERLDSREAYGAIISATPTPELWGTQVSHTDEDEIGRYLRVEQESHTFYSYVDPQTGAYLRVGLIERVSRFADSDDGRLLFDDSASPAELDELIAGATASSAFAGVALPLVESLLRAARRAERNSRHKYNPGCPTMGDRDDLLAAGILTNELPLL